MGHSHVVRPGQPGDGVQQDNYVLAVLHEALGLVQDHLRHLGVPVGGLVEGGADDLGVDMLFHVRHLLGPLVDQQHDQVALRMVGRDGVGHVLEQHGLTGLGRRDDQPPLSHADRRNQVHHAHRERAALPLQADPVLRVARPEVVERDPVLRLLRIVAVDRLDLQEGQVALALLWGPDLTQHRIPRSQVEPLDLRGAHIDVIGPVQVVPGLGPEEAVPFGENLEHALPA